MSGQHTKAVTMHKCVCGHPSCDQFTLSTQGGVGFAEADARLYTTAPEMLDALRWAAENAEASEAGRDGAWYEGLDQVLAAIAKATGGAA